MPPRDPDPSLPLSPEDSGPEGRRWAPEPPRDVDRRYGRSYDEPRPRERGSPPDEAGDASGSTFTHSEALGRPGSAFSAAARERAVGRMGPASGQGGGRAHGWEQDPGPQSRGRPDSADWSQSVYDRSEASRPPRRADWERRPQDPPGAPLDSSPTRTWRQTASAAESSRPARAGLERPDDTQFDADYRQWREEQMRMLDREYAQWRQERYRKFAEEFSQWRSQRLQAQPGATPRAAPAEPAPSSLGNTSALGPVPGAAAQGEDRARERGEREERERSSGGGLLSSLLGGHSERHKPQP